MTLRLLLLAVLACAPLNAYAQVLSPRPWTPPKGVALPDTLKKGISYIGGVPDTGQFIPDSTTLARVDERIIRVSDFREGFFSSYIEYRPRPDSAGKAQFLGNMVNKEILGLAALQINRPLTFEDRSVMREHTQRVLSNIVFQRLVADSARPTEADLRHAHAQMGWELRVKRISFSDRDTAERVLAALRAKKVSWKDAQKRSTSRKDGPEGDIGWVQRAVVDPIIGADLFDLEPGKISDVLHDAQGYHVAIVTERRRVKAPAFEASRVLLGNLVTPVKMTQRIETVRAQVRPRVHWQLDHPNIRWAAERIGETQLVRQDAFGQVLDLSGHLPHFPPEDTSRVLARWDGGQFTLGRFMTLYSELPLAARQNINNELAFEHQVETFAFEPFMAEIARERGLDRDPVAIQLIERKREELLVEHLFSDSVLAKVRVTDADREKYYKDNIGQFHSYQTARYAVIHRWTKAGSDSVVAALQAGTKAQEILRADSLRGDKVVGAIREVRDDKTDTYEKILFEEMRVGDVRRFGPYKDGDYEVLQLLAFDPGRQLELREVMGIVDESVRNIAAEKQLNALLARERPKRRIVVHPERLAFVRMADPTLD